MVANQHSPKFMAYLLVKGDECGLYSGPAINILAIVLSYKVFGWKMGVSRMVGAIVFAFVIGLLMQMIFSKEDEKRLADERLFQNHSGPAARSLGQMALFMFSMIGILVFVNWAPSNGASTLWDLIYQSKYWITGAFALVLIYALVRWFTKDNLREWGGATRDFVLQILPLLFSGVLVAGFLLGRPGHETLIHSQWVAIPSSPTFSQLYLELSCISPLSPKSPSCKACLVLVWAKGPPWPCSWLVLAYPCPRCW